MNRESFWTRRRWLQAASSWVIVGGVLLGGAGSARAELLVYEPFDYDDGTLLDGAVATGLNLVGPYTPLGPIAAQKVVVSGPGLDYGNLVGAPQALGNRANDLMGVTSAGATVDLDEEVVVNQGDSIFFSALFTLDDSSNGNRLAHITFTNDENGDAIAFGESVVGVRTIRIEADTVATGDLIAAGVGGSFENGQTLLLVGRYFNSGARSADRLELIGYDTADGDVLPLSFDPTDPNAEFAFELTDRDIDFTKITSITFRIRGDDNNFIDELRIGTTYASVVVVPEAGTMVLAVVAAWGAAVLARRRSGAIF